MTPLLANAYAALLRSRVGSYGIDLADVDLTAGTLAGHNLDPNPNRDRLAKRIEASEGAQKAASEHDSYHAVPEDASSNP